MRRTFFAATAALALSAGLQGATSARAADYTIDPSHTHILFMVNHLGLSNMIGLLPTWRVISALIRPISRRVR